MELHWCIKKHVLPTTHIPERFHLTKRTFTGHFSDMEKEGR